MGNPLKIAENDVQSGISHKASLNLIKDKEYRIACLGPYEYNQYNGIGTFTGRIENWDDYLVYEFVAPDTNNKDDLICISDDKWGVIADVLT